MPTLVLANKQIVVIRWHHSQPEKRKPRETVAVLDIPGHVFTARARCSPHDNFCRRTGRLLAAQRLVRTLRLFATGLTSKDDRRRIFQLICPEHS